MAAPRFLFRLLLQVEEGVLAQVLGGILQLLLDAEQLVVLGHTVGAAGDSDFLFPRYTFNQSKVLLRHTQKRHRSPSVSSQKRHSKVSVQPEAFSE